MSTNIAPPRLCEAPHARSKSRKISSGNHLSQTYILSYWSAAFPQRSRAVFLDFSASRPRLAATLARFGSLGVAIDTPVCSRPWRRGSEVTKSRLRVLRSPSQPQFLKTYSPFSAQQVFDKNTKGFSNSQVAIYEFSGRPSNHSRDS